MRADQILSRFLDYFAGEGHRVLPSSSPVSADDSRIGERFGMRALMLEGGGRINGGMLRAGNYRVSSADSASYRAVAEPRTAPRRA